MTIVLMEGMNSTINSPMGSSNKKHNRDVSEKKYGERGDKDMATGSSRVLMLRNLARGVTELDVEGFVQPFTKGFRPKIYLQASAGRAFVEFIDEEAAANALHYFSLHPIQLKGTNVSVAYSRRDAVVTTHENANNLTDQFRILLASVTNLYYGVDIDLLHFLFSKYGTVEKIVTFSKTPTMYQALIQFKYADEAKQALCTLHNRNIYDGCNTLQIQPSRLTELVVKTNNSKSVDYTVAANNQNILNDYNGNSNMHATNNNFNKYNGAIGPGVLPTPASINNSYGNSYVGSGVGMRYGMGNQSYGSGFTNVAGGSAVGGGGLMTSNSSMYNLPKEIREITAETFNKSQTPVIICYNLPSDINVNKLFNLFSLYGSVIRIKILREKPDTALVQFSDSFYASLACYYLQNAVIGGNEIQIDFSKNQEVKVPSNSANYNGSNQFFNSERNEENDMDVKTRSFQIKEQRYGQLDEVEKYIKGACRPTSTLFVANVSEGVNEDDIRKLFEEFGKVNKVVFKPPKEGSKTQMAVVSMATEVEALNGLINLHNASVNNRLIKVAFSKSVVN